MEQDPRKGKLTRLEDIARIAERANREYVAKKIVQKKTFSRAEAAEILGVSLGTITRWLKKGQLRGYKTGSNRSNHWRIPVEEVERYRQEGPAVGHKHD